MEEYIEYECPECGASVPEGARFCTSCEAEFDPDVDGTEAVDTLLEEIARPREPEEVTGEEETDEPSEEEPPEEISPEEVLEKVLPVTPRKPRLLGGTFSVLGASFIVLTLLALVATVLFLHWDTWINGAAEETVGDYQMDFVYLGAVGTIVCLIVVIVDVLRNRRGSRG